MLFWRGRLSPGLIAVFLSNVLLVALLTINAVIPPTSGGVGAALLNYVLANPASSSADASPVDGRGIDMPLSSDWSRELAQNVTNLNEMPRGACRLSRSAVASRRVGGRSACAHANLNMETSHQPAPIKPAGSMPTLRSHL